MPHSRWCSLPRIGRGPKLPVYVRAMFRRPEGPAALPPCRDGRSQNGVEAGRVDDERVLPAVAIHTRKDGRQLVIRQAKLARDVPEEEAEPVRGRQQDDALRGQNIRFVNAALLTSRGPGRSGPCLGTRRSAAT